MLAAWLLRDSGMTPEIVKKLFDDIGPRFNGRNGGYTRVVKLGPR